MIIALLCAFAFGSPLMDKFDFIANNIIVAIFVVIFLFFGVFAF
ncbi:hypothetical protein [Campylobacter iguaniorum]|nr:hypothetical protein [Campylobacter iguaniorum]